MSLIVTTCASCQREFEPDRASIVRGDWRTCPDCRSHAAGNLPELTARCEACGRVLPAGDRAMCHSCLTEGSGGL